jgi:hypothetical protein
LTQPPSDEGPGEKQGRGIMKIGEEREREREEEKAKRGEKEREKGRLSLKFPLK